MVYTTLLWKLLSLYVLTFSWKVILEVAINKCNFHFQATENKRVTSLKRYLRLAGIHTVTYSKVLQNCRSNKAKIEGLLDLLRKEGLKGAYANVVEQVVSVITRLSFWVQRISLWWKLIVVVCNVVDGYPCYVEMAGSSETLWTTCRAAQYHDREEYDVMLVVCGTCNSGNYNCETNCHWCFTGFSLILDDQLCL